MERVADPLHGATHLLRLDQTRVERLADVGDADRLVHRDAAGLGIDRDLGAADADLPEDRTLGIGAAAAFGAHFAVPDQLAADHAEVGLIRSG